MNRKKIKRQNLIQLLLVVVIVILLNLISVYVFERFDLTAEKRYTLSPATTTFLEEMKDVAYFKVYLNGKDLPHGFKRLQNATREMLDEFRNYAGDNIEYEFIDPFESPDLSTRGEIGRELMQKGLTPTNIEERDESGGVSEKLLFAGTIVSYRDKEIALELLQNNMAISGEENLNNSIQAIEFRLVNTLMKLSKIQKEKIAFIEGHGELSELEVADISHSLSESYEVDRVKINGKLNRLDGVDCIIIAKPDSTFSSQDKYIIDQFIMKGGKSLWLIDGVNVSMDSLMYSSSVLALINQVNLEDQLFKYGVRINPNLIQDMQCGGLRLKTSMPGAPLKFRTFPWIYFPLLMSNNDFALSKNLDLVKTQFTSSLDTVGHPGKVKKEFLLYSSERSRSVNAPIQIKLNIVNEVLEDQYFNKSFLPVAVLLEGEFESVYKNRLSPEFTDNKEAKYKESSRPTKMIVVADGDIIRNDWRVAEGQYAPLPLGYDKHTDMSFAGNKDFILNSINYLLDDSGVMEVRSREIKLRLLDKARVQNDHLFWKLLNVLAPLLFIITFGILFHYFRKRKYSK
ncbi:MAG: gliding motility-associated ABC transporter substrate-binding protein GldG [Bacteroidales bacterium]|nr:gliding motility-associated ABC transporter substrate-binding protein GldG [Bacteroidales bacterium]MCF8456545.1 gliding motility-associated ABC transporter substrate-binding protein GldG [Bacteroidales bacterium]